MRQALAFDKVALYGVSYGTKLAMAYALAHPDHVERLLLDSVLPPELPDPYSANVLRDLPATLSSFCSDGSCKAATSNSPVTSSRWPTHSRPSRCRARCCLRTARRRRRRSTG